MPKLTGDMDTTNIGGRGFHFSSVRIEKLSATEYTLVTIAIDETGSIGGFENDLTNALVTAVESCKKSPRADNLLLRVIKFSTSLSGGGIEELHGFKPLADIDVKTYAKFSAGGSTNLYDAVYSGIGATNVFAKQLIADDFQANGIVFIITDGGDNASTVTPKMIKNEVEKALHGEHIESLITILIGINASQYQKELDEFKNDAGLTQYIDVGSITKGKLAKLAAFVSQSISSQSQALGTGGPSQNISATI